MSSKVLGKRKEPEHDGHLRLEEGEYGKNPHDGNWYARPPGFYMGNLAAHDVIEHKDGTITVSPSILINHGENQWHGYLEQGVWRQC